MDAASTITEISNSSDLVWDLVCRYEDGERWTRAEYAQLSEGDRKILEEETNRIHAKADRAAQAAKARNCHVRVERKESALDIIIAREERANRVTSGFDFEGAILARQLRDCPGGPW